MKLHDWNQVVNTFVQSLHERGSMARSEDDLLVQLAWLYYVGNHNQEEIANRLGLSRFKINRLLARARETGVVRISIDHATVETLEQGALIANAFGLAECIVTPACGGSGDMALDEANARRAVGIAAAAIVARRLQAAETLTIGLAWGRTIAAMVDEMPKLSKPGTRIVSLMGSLSRTARTNSFDCVHALAQRIDGEGYLLPTPFIADSAADYDVIMSQRLVTETLELARSSDFIVASFGDASKNSFISEHNLLHADEIETLARAGAVADMLGKFFGADGEPVESPLNKRTPSISIDDMRKREIVVLAAGRSKATALVALLRSGLVNRLVLDGDLAEDILEGLEAR
jgi:DNA-binding transcriptional regulator LsrR (DeoR family)